MDFKQRKVRVALISVVSNSALMAMKLVVGMLVGSVSILSEAIHSGIDLLAAVIALFSVRTSSIPADKEHPFGHGKIENVSGTIEALLIFAAAIWIIVEAAKKMIQPEPLDALGWGVSVMAVSAIVNIVVSEMLFKVGRDTDSIALQADAWHLRTDVYTSAGVMFSLAAIWMGHRFFPAAEFDWLDPAAAFGVATLIIKAAYDLTKESARDLLDVNLPATEEEWIRRQIFLNSSGIHGYHRMRTRKAGHYRFVEFHLMVNPGMSVQESHSITDDLTRIIKGKFPGTSVTVHVEPCNGKCNGHCLEGCLLTDDERTAARQDGANGS
jgi:cation diffusion facilitator family transporter